MPSAGSAARSVSSTFKCFCFNGGRASRLRARSALISASSMPPRVNAATWGTSDSSAARASARIAASGR